MTRSDDPDAAPRKRLVILLSGRGSNALTIADAIDEGRVPLALVGAIADRRATGLDALADRGVDTVEIRRKAFPDRAAFEAALDDALAAFAPDLVAMAGFMRVLSSEFVERHAGRLINIHPSLLPAYRGLDTHARALQDRAEVHGASVHWVTAELDGGPVIAQARVPVRPDDGVKTLTARVLAQEHRLYPAVLALLARDEVRVPHDPPLSPGESNDAAEPLVLDRDLDAAGRRIARPGG